MAKKPHPYHDWDHGSRKAMSVEYKCTRKGCSAKWNRVHGDMGRDEPTRCKGE